MDRHLRRVRSGDEVGRAEEVEELLSRQPATPADDLVLHQRDVSGGATEPDDAELEKEARDLARSASGHGGLAGWIARGGAVGHRLALRAEYILAPGGPHGRRH